MAEDKAVLDEVYIRQVIAEIKASIGALEASLGLNRTFIDDMEEESGFNGTDSEQQA